LSAVSSPEDVRCIAFETPKMVIRKRMGTEFLMFISKAGSPARQSYRFVTLYHQTHQISTAFQSHVQLTFVVTINPGQCTTGGLSIATISRSLGGFERYRELHCGVAKVSTQNLWSSNEGTASEAITSRSAQSFGACIKNR